MLPSSSRACEEYNEVKYIVYTLGKLGICYEGEQNMPLQNMPLWHIERFELQVPETQQPGQEGPSGPPPLPSLKTGYKSPM